MCEGIFFKSGFGAAKVAAPNPDFRTGLLVPGFYIFCANNFSCAVQSPQVMMIVSLAIQSQMISFVSLFLFLEQVYKMILSGSQKRHKRPKYYRNYQSGGSSGVIGHGAGSSSSNPVNHQFNGPSELNEANYDCYNMNLSSYDDDADDGVADKRDSETFNAAAFEAVGFSAFVRSELNEEGAQVNDEENCLIEAARRASRGNIEDSANDNGDIEAPTLHFEAYTSNKRGQCFNIARDHLVEILTQMNAPLYSRLIML